MANFNINDLSNLSNNYKSNVLFIIDKIETQMFWCKEYILPGVQMTPQEIDYSPHSIKKPTNKFTYDDLPLNFFVDENLTVYQEIYNWLMLFENGSYTEADDIVTAQLLLFDTSLTRVIKRALFYDLFPINLGQLDFRNERNDEENILQIQFSYSNWELKNP